jgi:hypothetical protein
MRLLLPNLPSSREEGEYPAAIWSLDVCGGCLKKKEVSALVKNPGDRCFFCARPGLCILAASSADPLLFGRGPTIITRSLNSSHAAFRIVLNSLTRIFTSPLTRHLHLPPILLPSTPVAPNPFCIGSCPPFAQSLRWSSGASISTFPLSQGYTPVPMPRWASTTSLRYAASSPHSAPPCLVMSGRRKSGAAETGCGL